MGPLSVLGLPEGESRQFNIQMSSPEVKGFEIIAANP